MTNYLLDKDHNVVETDDILEWATGFEMSNRRVDETTVGNIRISTVFLGLDHNMFGDKPALFETMIFGGKYDEYMWRYAAWDEAVEGHKKAVKRVKKQLRKGSK